ncbi:hypothetical protein AAMO2058_001570300 [Amorphochlora amoebiformis]
MQDSNPAVPPSSPALESKVETRREGNQRSATPEPPKREPESPPRRGKRASRAARASSDLRSFSTERGLLTTANISVTASESAINKMSVKELKDQKVKSKEAMTKIQPGCNGESKVGSIVIAPEGKMELLDPAKYSVKRGEEELKVVARTIELIKKRDPSLLKRYRDDPHKLSRVVMREVRPKNGFNCEKAARFYQETVEWREKFHFEHILRYPPGKLHTFNLLFPDLGYGCFDRDGYPVLFMRFGLSTGKQVTNRLSYQDFTNCHAYQLDLMELMCRQESKKRGKWIDKMRVVIDFEGVSIFALRDLLTYVKRCAHMDTTFYTGLMLSTHLINVPQSLSWATALFWPFISSGVKRKIKIFTTNYKDELIRLMPLESLPRIYGGKREWDFCNPASVDWKSYDAEARRTCRKAFELGKIFLKNSSTHSIKIPIKKGTELSYYFETDVTALTFQLEMKRAKDGKVIEYQEPTTRKCHQIPEKNLFNFFDDGEVTLTWKNENGWSTRKQTLTVGYKTRKIQVPEVDGGLGHLRLIN